MQQPIAKLFATGGSQAVRLPAEFRFEGATEVYIRRDETTGDIILSTRPLVDWGAFIQLRERLGPIPDDFLTDQPERVFVSETVREKVLQHTRAELPFSTAVAVDRFDESERERLLRLYCTIYVEQESQKPIVSGRRGEMIKRIGTDARKDLERFFDTKVFLDLRVKVNADWRNDERTLDTLGVPKPRPRRKR